VARQSDHGSFSPYRTSEDDREDFVSVGTPIALRIGRFLRRCCWEKETMEVRVLEEKRVRL